MAAGRLHSILKNIETYWAEPSIVRQTACSEIWKFNAVMCPTFFRAFWVQRLFIFRARIYRPILSSTVITNFCFYRTINLRCLAFFWSLNTMNFVIISSFLQIHLCCTAAASSALQHYNGAVSAIDVELFVRLIRNQIHFDFSFKG